MKYHVVKNGKPDGPYTVEELVIMKIAPDAYVWAEGMPNWVKAIDVEEIAIAIAIPEPESISTPPVIPDIPSAPVPPAVPVHEPIETKEPESKDSDIDECPPNHLGWAIAAMALFFPLGIPALIKSIFVNIRWNQGLKEEALIDSQSAYKFGRLGTIIGAVFYGIYITFLMFAAAL